MSSIREEFQGGWRALENYSFSSQIRFKRSIKPKRRARCSNMSRNHTDEAGEGPGRELNAANFVSQKTMNAERGCQYILDGKGR